MKYEDIELFIKNNWISIKNILYKNPNILKLNIKNIEIYKDKSICTIFQICNYFNMDYKFLKVRQIINIITSGDKNFKGNSNCKCIICNCKFKAIRSNIKICASDHFCNLYCLYSGEKYQKQIMKWNKIEHNGSSTYLYGKCFKERSFQISTNNVYTMYNGTNNICNMTNEKRSEIIKNQIKNGTNYIICADYKTRSINNSKIAKNRVKNGTHNFLHLTKEQKNLAYKNSIKNKKANGIYSKMMKKRWKNNDFRNYMSIILKERWAKNKDYRDLMVSLLSDRWDNEEFREMMTINACNNAKILKGKGLCIICGRQNEIRDLIGRGKNCGCSQKWYIEHNRSEKMKEVAKENRKKQLDFYKNKMEKIIKFKNIHFNSQLLNINDFNNFNEVCGVWVLWGINKETKYKECLTVGQSKNIGKELNWTIRVLLNKNLQKLEEESPGCTGRWNYIQQLYENYSYIICKEEQNFEIREIIEATYASNNNALYWLPSITQQSNNFKEKLIEYINN